MRFVGFPLAVMAIAVVAAACGDDIASNPLVTTSSGGSGGSSVGGGGNAPECLTDSECPAASSACAEPRCIAGSCGFAALAAGTPLATQMAGDCQALVCDGSGNEQLQIDDGDLPNDGSDCTEDVCIDGVPSNPAISTGSACLTGVCDGQGTCVECNVPTDCAGNDDDCMQRSCTAGSCGVTFASNGTPVTLQTTGDCQLDVCDGQGSVVSSADDTDLPDDFNDCTADSCQSGVPVHAIQTGQACGMMGVCDASGSCVGCLTANDCPGNDDFCKQRTCNANVCGLSFTAASTPLPAAQQTSGNCQQLVCDGAGATQSTADNVDVPVDSIECTDDVCNSGTPANPPKTPGTTCSQNGGSVCNASGQCVGCNVPADCPGPGMPCKVATCSASTCGIGNAPSGTVCAAASCASGTQQNADTCDAAGTCIDNGSVMCSPYICGPTMCTGSCVGNSGCASGFVCDTGLGVCTNGPTCTDYCNIIQTNCTGVNQQYTSMASCLASCAGLPKGTAADTSGDTVGCRTYHGTVAGTDPVTHCTHAGPGGAGACGANCAGFCDIAQTVCVAANQQYVSGAACLSECGGFPMGTKYSTAVVSGDSYACRLYHLTQAAVDPVVHCGHIVEASPTCQ